MWDWLNDKTKQIEKEYIIEPVNNYFLDKVGEFVVETSKDAWTWFVDALPDIAGFGVYAAGAFIMISPLVTRGGMLKPLAYLAGGLIVTVCILATN